MTLSSAGGPLQSPGSTRFPTEAEPKSDLSGEERGSLARGRESPAVRRFVRAPKEFRFRALDPGRNECTSQ